MTRAGRRNAGSVRAVRVLPDDACPACGTVMRERLAQLRRPVNGEEVTVPSASHLWCPSCGEIVLRFGEAKHLHQQALAIYRSRHGLLAPDEIRAIRERLGLTQTELARLLRLSANTVARWEAGRNVQTTPLDLLLRMLRDVPGSIDYLRDHAA